MDRGQATLLAEMVASWPFFAVRLSMLEMVFAKADAGLSAYYDQRLVPEALQPLGAALRSRLATDSETVLRVTGASGFLEDLPWVRQSIALRNIYTDPLNVLQAELLYRHRQNPEPLLEQAIMVTIAGVAAGMRNTG